MQKKNQKNKPHFSLKSLALYSQYLYYNKLSPKSLELYNKYLYFNQNNAGWAIRDILQSDDIKKHPELIPELIMEAVKDKNGLSIKYILESDYIKKKHPEFITKELFTEAVRTNGANIKYILESDYIKKHPEFITKELFMAAVNSNGYAIKYIFEYRPDLITPEMFMAAVNSNGHAIECILESDYIKKHPEFITKELFMTTVRTNGETIRHILKSTYIQSLSNDEIQKLCTAAVIQNKRAIRHIPDKLIPVVSTTSFLHNKIIFTNDITNKIPTDNAKEMLAYDVKQMIGKYINVRKANPELKPRVVFDIMQDGLMDNNIVKTIKALNDLGIKPEKIYNVFEDLYLSSMPKERPKKQLPYQQPKSIVSVLENSPKQSMIDDSNNTILSYKEQQSSQQEKIYNQYGNKKPHSKKPIFSSSGNFQKKIGQSGNKDVGLRK